jgi:hypothetical protein
MVSEDVVQRVVGYMQHQATKPRADVIAMVAENQQKLADVFASVSEEAAAIKPAADEWSLRDLIRHVIDAEDSVASLIADAARGRQPKPRGGIGSMVEDDGRAFSAFVDRLRESNELFQRTMGELPETPDLGVTPKHPFFGPLNCLEWCIFQRVHDADHIQHAQKIIAAVAP